MRLATHTRKMHLEKWHPVVVYMGVEKHAKHEKTTVSVTLSKAYCGKTFHKFNWELNAISDCLLWRDFAVKNVKKFLGGPRAWWFDWVLGATTSLWQGHFGPLVVSTCHCSLAASNIIPISPNLPPAGNRMTRSKFCAATCELLIFHNSARWPPLSSSVYFWQVSISFKRKGNPKRAICRGSHRPDIVVSESCAFFSRFPAHRHGKRKKNSSSLGKRLSRAGWPKSIRLGWPVYFCMEGSPRNGGLHKVSMTFPVTLVSQRQLIAKNSAHEKKKKMKLSTRTPNFRPSLLIRNCLRVIKPNDLPWCWNFDKSCRCTQVEAVERPLQFKNKSVHDVGGSGPIWSAFVPDM